MQEKVRLNEIFVCSDVSQKYSLTELIHLSWKKSFLRLMEQRLQMVYNTAPENLNVCFAGDQELRNDFKTQFTDEELRRYIAACLPDKLFVLNETELPLPTDRTDFFKDNL
ncbi:MAG: hypothetical protein ACK5M7_08600 [Draconibacterium sp.]